MKIFWNKIYLQLIF